MVGSAHKGYQVGRVLDGSVGRVREQVEQYIVAMKQLDEQVSDLVSRRGEALLQLSRHYLPNMSVEAIQGTFREIRSDLLSVLEEKRLRERDLRSVLDDIEGNLVQSEQELDRVTELLNVKVEDREQLEKLLAERLHASEEFLSLSARALDAEVELEKNEARVAEAQREASEKLPSYDESRLFKYLHERSYGSGDYKSKGLTRVLDGWLAKMIDFRKAKRSYEFLKVTPELMANEVSRRREQFNVLMEQVEAIEDRNSDEIGLTQVMRDGQQLGSQRDELLVQLADLQQQLLTNEEELLRLSKPNNKFHEHAIARMRQFLSKVEDSKLERRSRETPEREDDAIVSEVIWLNDQLDDAQRQESIQVRSRQAWDDKLAGLQQVQQRFRAAEFDSRRSLFSRHFQIESHVERYLSGELGAEGLWSAIRNHQEFVQIYNDGPFGRGGRSGWGGRGGGLGDILGGEVSHVLFRVLADAAGEAMRQSVRRGMERRGPIRSQQRRSAGRPQLPRRGFTKGKGF